MSQASRQAMTITSAADFLALLGNGTVNLLAKMQRQRKLSHNRRLISELSDRQLADAGIGRPAKRAPRPALVIEAGLMANLMSMR